METKNFMLKFILLVGFIIAGIFLVRPVLAVDYNHSYPRTGIFSWSGPRSEYYAKFDLIIAWTNKSDFARKVKAINSKTYILSTREWNAGLSLETKLPIEWTVKNADGSSAYAYCDPSTGNDCSSSAFLFDITSSYCPVYTGTGTISGISLNGLRYNDFVAKYSGTKLVDFSFFDGVFSEGITLDGWPRGGKNVDLDKDGTADLDQHDTAWRKQVWEGGTLDAIKKLRQIINDKIFIYNSGQFHTFAMAQTNGPFLEHAGISKGAWTGFVKNYDKWTKEGATPHAIFFNFGGDKLDNFRWMRFGLGVALYGDAYYSYDDYSSTGALHQYVHYYDEYDLDLGLPISKMQKVKNGSGSPYNNYGIFVRFFQKGMVMLNVDVEPNRITKSELEEKPEISEIFKRTGPYYHFKGGQDPETNNGKEMENIIKLEGSTYGNYIVGDAIIYIKEPNKAVIADIIIDNNSGGNNTAGTTPGNQPAEFSEPAKWQKLTSSGLNWTLGAGSYTANGKNYSIFTVHHTTSKSESNYVIFRPKINWAGKYKIYEWHADQSNINEATNVVHEIKFGNKT